MDQKSTAILVVAVLVGLTGYITKFIITRLLGYIVSFWVGFSAMILVFGWLMFMDAPVNPPTPSYRPFAFLKKENWGRELRELSRDKPMPASIFAESFVLSDSIDVLLEYVVRDFIKSWYRKFTTDTLFTGQVEYIIKMTVQRLGERVETVDWADFLVRKLLPVVTDHFDKFVEADTAVRRGSSQHQLTESRELDNAVAEEFKRRHLLHPAVVAKSYEYESFRKQWLRQRVASILPNVLDQPELDAKIVSSLVTDIASCSVLFPVANMLSDPDFWNQTVLKLGGSTLQDQQKVQKLRKALDEHAKSGKSKQLRLGANATNQQFVSFMRGIYKISSINEARQTRYYIVVQLKRTKRDDVENATYMKRLEQAKKSVDKQISRLTSSGANNDDDDGGVARPDTQDARENYTLVQILGDSACNLYFMEFMDQRRRTGVLQFWMTVNSLRDAFKYEGEDSDPLVGLQTSSADEKMTNKGDILQIYQSYLSNQKLVSEIGPTNHTAIEQFAVADQSVENYKSARRALLEAQDIVFHKIEARDLPKFKHSDLFLKFLASSPPPSSGTTQNTSVDQLQMDGISESQSSSPRVHSPTPAAMNNDSFADVQEAFNDIMKQSIRLESDDTSHDQVHMAGPGDLGLTEAIGILSQDIDKLYSQLTVLESLLSKAELTNNTTELRILHKSKSSLEREVERKELQRQQYMVQESENSLYGRSAIAIQSYMHAKDQVGEYVLYIIEVTKYAHPSREISAGWIVARRYSQFFELHQHLKLLVSQVAKLDFPKKRMVLKFQQKSFIDARRVALEKYLKHLLEIPEVCRSKTFRLFLSSETFSVDSLTLSSPQLNQEETVTDDMSSSITSLREADPDRMVDSPDLMEESSTQPFVQPICDAFIQFFGVNKRGSSSQWLMGRATVVVIQQLLGGTIEKKIREIITQTTSSRKVSDILQTLIQSLWPNGLLRSKSEARSSTERTKTKHDAQHVLQQLLVDSSSRVVGMASSRYASSKIFAMYQNEVLNANLVYTLIDKILDELF